MIRPAQPQDAPSAVHLIYAAIGRIAHLLTDTDKDEEVLAVLAEFFQQDANRLSYQNALVKEQEGQVVGILISYHGSQTYDMDLPFLRRLIQRTRNPHLMIPKEAQDDEYYLDTVSVDPRYQGRGFGSELLRAFEHKAASLGYKKLALLAEPSNESAYRLYVKTGYQPDGQVTVSGYEFDHMVKHI
ncbi:MAG: GNAT family N-acetyltransferase [Tumebacillaceae bacterium]